MRNRRDILKAGACALAGAGLPLRGFAQQAGAPLEVTPISDGIVLISGGAANVLAASDGQAVTLVDSGPAGRTDALLAAVESAFPGQPVATVFNTHWHPDQTGGNPALGRSGAQIVAHANTRLWLTTDVTWPWNGQTVDPIAPEGLPTEIFHWDGGERGSGAARARYGYLLQAHTDGDAWVYFPRANVLAAGGALTTDRWPLIDWWTGGWFGGLVEGMETLVQLTDENTRIVPAQGPVIGRADLRSQAEMYAELYLHFRDELLFQGLSPVEAADRNPTAGLRPGWGNPDAFVIRAYESLWGYYAPDV